MLIRGLTEPVRGGGALGLSPSYVLSVRVPAREHGTGAQDVGMWRTLPRWEQPPRRESANILVIYDG